MADWIPRSSQWPEVSLFLLAYMARNVDLARVLFVVGVGIHHDVNGRVVWYLQLRRGIENKTVVTTRSDHWPDSNDQ